MLPTRLVEKHNQGNTPHVRSDDGNSTGAELRAHEEDDDSRSEHESPQDCPGLEFQESPTMESKQYREHHPQEQSVHTRVRLKKEVLSPDGKRSPKNRNRHGYSYGGAKESPGGYTARCAQPDRQGEKQIKMLLDGQTPRMRDRCAQVVLHVQQIRPQERVEGLLAH